MTKQNQGKSGEMHPQDLKNLVLFIIIAIALWTGFDHFVMGPKKEELRAAQAQKTLVAKQQAEGIARSTDPMTFADPQLPLDEVLKKSIRVPFDTPKIDGTISLSGGRIDDLSLKNYFETLKKEKEVTLLQPAGAAHPFYAQTGWVAGANPVAVPGKDTLWTVEGNNSLSPGNPVTLTWNNGAGLTFKRTFDLDKNYLFTITDKVENATGADITLYPYALIARRGVPESHGKKSSVAYEGPIAYVNGDLLEPGYKSFKKKPQQVTNGESGWIGMSEKYWLAALLPGQTGSKSFRFLSSQSKDEEARPLYQADITDDEGMTIAAGQSGESSIHLFAGAKEIDLLDKYEDELNIKHFDLAVDFGVLYFMTRPFYWLLTTFFDLTGNFGIAIILLTLLIRAAVFPLASTSYRSFASLRKVAPEMQTLREKYKDDKAQLQKEMVKLYEREKVNPMAGCLPLLLQIPIFFAMYKVIYITIEMRHAPFFGWIKDLSEPDPTTIFNLFGLIPWNPPAALMIGVWPCLMLFFMILQQRLNPPPQDPTQKVMMKYFPFFITYILSGFAAGLVIYWTFSNAFSVIQQYIIMRSTGADIHLFSRSKAEKKLEEQVEKGPAIHPQMQMIEDDVEEALFGDDEPTAKAKKDKSDKKDKKK
ncbi:MAG: membrane protein insertase YidC [Pseudobdellovibrionaceae bacterium]